MFCRPTTFPPTANKAVATRSSVPILTLVAIVGCLIFGTEVASASKEVISYFGSESGSGSLGGNFDRPGDIAVNSSGAGPASRGDIYVVDNGNTRIQRFSQDDNGTPANPYDDDYKFVSAWGAGVETGGDSYEVCSVAANCRAGIGSGGNGGLGADPITNPRRRAITVDQGSGDVYVLDRANFRVSVYSGDGGFLRSFGWDVIAAGPDDAGVGFEICVSANGDVCKSGVPGGGIGQLGGSTVAVTGAEGIAVSALGAAGAGIVFVADTVNNRLNTYALDGSSPASVGSASSFGTAGPLDLATDSRGIVYAEGGSQPSDWTIARYDAQNANGIGSVFLAPISIPPLLTQGGAQVNAGLEVEADSDAIGPDADALYALRGLVEGSVVQQFGPQNSPGVTAPPSASDGTHGTLATLKQATGLGIDEATGRLFVSSSAKVNDEAAKSGVYVLDTAGGPPTASLDSISDIASTTAKIHATINPNGPPVTKYQLEYSTDGNKWIQTPQVAVGSQQTSQTIEAVLSPPPAGLQPNTFYHVRLAAAKVFAPAVTTSEMTFTTFAEAPTAETDGAPVRTATTAQLNGRVNPNSKATSFYFEYGAEGPCDENACTATVSRPAGAGGVLEFVAAEIAGLQPNTTYHYRLVAENGVGSPSNGKDATVVTRASDSPLAHGHRPGPPASDRAYEQVSVADSGGNPVGEATGFSDDGNRAAYSISGGTPISETGSFLSFYFAERTPSGWQTKNISPPRNALVGSVWSVNPSPSDLATINVRNFDSEGVLNTIWRLSPEGEPVRLFDVSPPTKLGIPGALVSVVIRTAENSPRLVLGLSGGELDPAYPAAAARENLYDVTSGSPHLVSLLPGNTVAACGIGSEPNAKVALSADGSLLFFPSQGSSNCGGPGVGAGGPARLYVRDLDAGTTRLVTPPPVSGSECGSAAVLRLTSEALFLWSLDRLTAEDTNPASCDGTTPPGGDIYRYGLADGSLRCVTCVVPGLDADVEAGGNRNQVAVSEDGSRIYFRSQSQTPLLPGAAVGASDSTYRLNAETGQLRWLGKGIVIDQVKRLMTPNGSVVLFESNAPSLNPLGATSDNGGTHQAYRYDDLNGSVVCISCPQDGSPPTSDTAAADLQQSAGGEIAGFATRTALAPADQNTPPAGSNPNRGIDVYEWRDGLLLLVTDGLTDWPNKGEAHTWGISPSGRDFFFTAAAQYTSDALDGYQRLYDARIGGGFDFSPPPKPCPLEVCQGTPKGTPEEVLPGSTTFTGPSNKAAIHPPARCSKGKRRGLEGKGKRRCARKQGQKARHKANNNRRAG